MFRQQNSLCRRFQSAASIKCLMTFHRLADTSDDVLLHELNTEKKESTTKIIEKKWHSFRGCDLDSNLIIKMNSIHWNWKQSGSLARVFEFGFCFIALSICHFSTMSMFIFNTSNMKRQSLPFRKMFIRKCSQHSF